MAGGGANSDVVPEFVWFGRERDMPPVTNTVYVDLNNISGYETGSSAHPYNTVTEGNIALQPNDRLIIRSGTYTESGIRFETPSSVESESGTATIQ